MYIPQRKQRETLRATKGLHFLCGSSYIYAVLTVVYILFFSLSSCSFRDYTNELKQLDSTGIVISAVQQQLTEVDTSAYLSYIQTFQKGLDSLKQHQAEHDTLTLVLRSQYLNAGKTCIAIVQETRRLNREAKIISEQIQKLKSDFDKHAYDEQSAREYAQAENSSAQRLAQSVNKFIQVVGEEKRKIESLR